MLKLTLNSRPLLLKRTDESKCGQLTFNTPRMKIAEFANSVDPDEVAHNEPPHLDLHCLPSSL